MHIESVPWKNLMHGGCPVRSNTRCRGRRGSRPLPRNRLLLRRRQQATSLPLVDRRADRRFRQNGRG